MITLVPIPEPAPGTYTALVCSRSPNPSIVGTGDAGLICPVCTSLLAQAVPVEAAGDIFFRCYCGTFSRLDEIP